MTLTYYREPTDPVPQHRVAEHCSVSEGGSVPEDGPVPEHCAGSKRTLSYHDIVVALTLPPSVPLDIVEDFDAELRRWLLSQR